MCSLNRNSVRRLCLLLCLCLAGCAPYGARLSGVLAAAGEGDYPRALTELEKKPEPGSALWQAQRGLLLRCAGRYRESNEAFAAASSIDEDLFTRSVSNEAAALAVSDAMRPYRFSPVELPYLRVYSALNYLDLGDREGALVEVRSLARMLEERRASRDDPADDWGFGRAFCAVLFESAGQEDDARVAWLAARAAYGARPAPDPDGMERIIAAGLSRTDSGPDAPPGGGSATGADALAFILVEEGAAPVLEDLHLRVPILKEEAGWGEDRLAGWSRDAGMRALAVRDGRLRFRRSEIAYFLDVAIPAIAAEDPVPPWEYAVREDLREERPVVLAEDVDLAVRENLDRNLPGIAVRAAARAIVKALATSAARKKTGTVGGWVANALGVATERADTRSWNLLPSRIGVAVVCDLPVRRADGAAGELATRITVVRNGETIGGPAGEGEAPAPFRAPGPGPLRVWETRLR